jgi:hypothetical protein
MGRRLIDHTNETHGSVYVIGRHPLNQRHWAVRWGCCGREQEISAERLAVIIKSTPERCINCVREHARENPEYYSAKAVRDRELREAKKMQENRPGEFGVFTIKDHNGWPWYALGKLGPRGG